MADTAATVTSAAFFCTVARERLCLCYMDFCFEPIWVGAVFCKVGTSWFWLQQNSARVLWKSKIFCCCTLNVSIQRQEEAFIYTRQNNLCFYPSVIALPFTLLREDAPPSENNNERLPINTHLLSFIHGAAIGTRWMHEPTEAERLCVFSPLWAQVMSRKEAGVWGEAAQEWKG